jgi:hypothetical protein
MGKREGAYGVLVGKIKEYDLLGDQMYNNKEDDVKMDVLQQ